jgi:hypothetical protein
MANQTPPVEIPETSPLSLNEMVDFAWPQVEPCREDVDARWFEDVRRSINAWLDAFDSRGLEMPDDTTIIAVDAAFKALMGDCVRRSAALETTARERSWRDLMSLVMLPPDLHHKVWFYPEVPEVVLEDDTGLDLILWPGAENLLNQFDRLGHGAD